MGTYHYPAQQNKMRTTSTATHSATQRRTKSIVQLLLACMSLFALSCTGASQGGTGPGSKAQLSPLCGRLKIQVEGVCSPVRPPNITSREVAFDSKISPGGRIQLRGSYTAPAWDPNKPQPAKVPGVILIHGSGPVDRDSLLQEDVKGPFAAPVPLFRELATSLSQQGYAVLRYDKRTCTSVAVPTCSYFPEVAKKATWTDLIGDAQAAFEFLKSQPNVDPNDIILIGHSQGASIALETQGVLRPSAVVLLAGTYAPIDEVLKRQLRWQLQSLKGPSAREQRERQQNRLSEVESVLLAIRDNQIPADEVILSATVGLWKGWLNSTDKTQEYLNSFTGPLLYIRGQDDKNADEADEKGFEKAIQSRQKSQLISLPGLSHALHERRGNGAISPQVTQGILEFLNQNP